MSDTNNQAVRPTRETYDPLQQAYETLNRALFEGSLPNCLITLQRSKKSYGYFCGDRFGKTDGTLTDEIALNPSHFRDRPQEAVLATLAHEMVHLWQHHFGKPGRGRYHNTEWAEKMKTIGFQPTSTGKEGGDETGDVMDHMIVPDGPFDRTVRKLLARGFIISWTEQPNRRAEVRAEMDAETKSGKRVRYACPHGDMKAWAKHGAKLVCGEHMEPMIVDRSTPRGYRDIAPPSEEA
ncbi:MAG TPA: SprT-like domain-containing protein [Candidatus Binataceae bacterium]|nr:SprT-like domain-containing protein [Candidatus Binataceae bacterium]